jgi:hypothetical protein
MRSTSEEISKIAKDFLEKNEIEYVSIDIPKYSVSSLNLNEKEIEHWSVGYEYKIFELVSAFIKIEDKSKKILFILTKHGRIFIDGVENKNIEDD